MSAVTKPAGESVMRKVPALTQDRLREVLSYDPETGLFTWLVDKARTARMGMVAGAINQSGYRHICIDGEYFKGGRLAWFWVHGRWPADVIDHINGGTADDRIANLREATVSQNIANSKRRRDNTVGLKGVSYFKAFGKWGAHIQKDNRPQHLGLFDTKEAAHEAYLKAAKELFGEFARAA